MPDNLNLKLFTFGLVVVEVAVVCTYWDLTHQLLDSHGLGVRNRTTSTLVLTTVKAGFVVTANVFKNKAVRHLI